MSRKKRGSDREARALAAADVIEVGGKKYRLRPVVAQHLVDLEREALSHYKRQFLQTYKDNADLLGDSAQDVLIQKMGEVAAWDLSDLPQKDAYDTSRLPVTNKAKKWIEDNYGEVPESDVGIRAVLNNALDQGKLTVIQTKELTGANPIQGRVRYDQWWVTAATAGMISFITSSIREDHPEITEKDVAGWSFPKLAEASRTVESITSASMGNG